MPSENFTGVLGSQPRRPSRIQSRAKSGAREKMKKELAAPNCAAVRVMPNSVLSVTRSAYNVIEPAPCSNSAQKTTVERVSKISTNIRSRSTLEQRNSRNHPNPANTVSDRTSSSVPTVSVS